MRPEDDIQSDNLQPEKFVPGSDQQLLYLETVWPPAECLTYQHPDDGISYEWENGRAHAFRPQRHPVRATGRGTKARAIMMFACLKL